ncbi:MAG: bifunctional pyr operon transcriptional regulator/uracil phosphoribosyltransferase PyrR [Betaproteobacteria bacterium]|nr:bifunctional pyr operon transcriptional regulator/uracil phosphoribosyltransferase PyrR [Pseudomonadota bacterium]NBO13335.1 bifunctional pyr operon transcriptional regulator/uracil phosphoribosyltransferase PyrR [Betaproteobacteria bacterium]NBO45259.1 bifunctional pyr operon transcriptional regulator/uracil phosphoribosyltransferase PyrR [Betaproteobacteria bacterium]NBQ10219.1 bifunctional pyr operon transcriptional regulator/uracil phosphoribosyltransferase PyrR [Betaproteobacteria bacter
MIVTTAKLPDPEIALQTLASQVKSRAGQDQCLRHVVGIHSGGAWVARRLLALLTQDSAVGALFDPVIGYLSSAFHRDDYGHNAQRRGLSAIVKGGTELPFEVTGARILLVDDVLYTGRTLRAAVNELFDYGRPAAVELAVLVDRGARELPVHADYVGATVDLSPLEAIVLAQHSDGQFSFSKTEG